MTNPITKGRGKGVQFLRSMVGHNGNECVLWPYCKDGNGRGQCAFNGRLVLAHRFLCEIVNGKPPSARHHAAHSCGNGHLGCVNPNHLSWKTQAENEADKRNHGRSGHGHDTMATLTQDQIAEIRASRGVVPAEMLAKRFGLKRGGIRYWWSTTHVPQRPSMNWKNIQRRQRAKTIREARSHSG